jgi:hypothetical protein
MVVNFCFYLILICICNCRLLYNVNLNSYCLNKITCHTVLKKGKIKRKEADVRLGEMYNDNGTSNEGTRIYDTKIVMLEYIL